MSYDTDRDWVMDHPLEAADELDRLRGQLARIANAAEGNPSWRSRPWIPGSVFIDDPALLDIIHEHRTKE